MKIGFDIHGVIDTKPDFFRELMQMLVAGGAEVHVISGPRVEQCRKELEAMKIYPVITEAPFGKPIANPGGHYTHIFSIVDFHIAKGTPVTQGPEGPEMDPYLWDQTKAAYCEREGIDLHLDDQDTYGLFFKTPFARFSSRDTPKIRKLRLQRWPEDQVPPVVK